MGTPRFDPSYSVEFDLGRGHVKLQGTAERVLVSVDALAALLQSAGEEATRDFGRRIGTEMGRRVAERLGEQVASADFESVVEHLGGEIALAGFGSLSAERWGRALLMVVNGSPFAGGGDELAAAIVEGALQRAFGRDVSAVRLVRDDAALRMLVTSRASGERVRAWLADGITWADAIARLHEPRGEA